VTIQVAPVEDRERRARKSEEAQEPDHRPIRLAFTQEHNLTAPVRADPLHIIVERGFVLDADNAVSVHLGDLSVSKV
jgi:hypothetical protein